MAHAPLRGFPPVIDSQVRTLILGSFPSLKSLEKRQYYGHPQNQFWKLLGRIVGVPLHELGYQDRLKALLEHRIGLWDVIGRCERAGSLDSAIRNATRNRFARVTRVAAGLRRVCFNGTTAGGFEPYFAEQGYETFVLPSSSPANTTPFPVKLRAWRIALATTRGTSKAAPGHRPPITGHGLRC